MTSHSAMEMLEAARAALHQCNQRHAAPWERTELEHLGAYAEAVLEDIRRAEDGKGRIAVVEGSNRLIQPRQRGRVILSPLRPAGAPGADPQATNRYVGCSSETDLHW